MSISNNIGVPILDVNRNPDASQHQNSDMSIGSRVREARREAKLSQIKLGAKVGMSQPALSELEKGDSFGTKYIASIAATLGVNALWLETGKGPKRPDSRPNVIVIDGVEIVDDQYDGADRREGAGRREVDNSAFDANVAPTNVGVRPVPVISPIQAGKLKEINDPYPPGSGFAVEYVDDDGLSPWAFGLEIDGDSMLPTFKPGDRVIIDPEIAPNPGDFVVARNSKSEATFKKYRLRGLDAAGNMVFELIPLNDAYPTMRSDIEHLEIIGVMVEHRQRYRRPKKGVAGAIEQYRLDKEGQEDATQRAAGQRDPNHRVPK